MKELARKLVADQLLLNLTALGENCALAANQSVDCHATTPFTIDLNSEKV